jgi:hypothetical protein
MVAGSIITELSSTAGLIAAAMAVGGFLAHAKPALARQHEAELRRATVIGGLIGLAVMAPGVVGIWVLT